MKACAAKAAVVRVAALVGCAAAGVGMALATPALATPSPYPNLDGYQRESNLEPFRVIDQRGVWLTTPMGLRCGIDDDGSYGCSGTLPGAPPGDNEVAWFVGDPFPRQYHTDQPRFDSGVTQNLLIGLSYVQFRGSTCAVTKESGIYCSHENDPNSQLMVTNEMTFRGGDATPSS